MKAKQAVKKLLLLFLTATAAGGVWYFFFRTPPVQFTLRTAKVERGDITTFVTASGKLNAVSLVEVGTQVSGTIQELYVDYNSPVREGQLIAQLDPAVLRSQLIESRAGLEVATAAEGSAGASLTDAERKFKRNRELHSRRLISQSELENSETDVLLRRAQLQEAKARVIQAKAAVERAQTNLDYTRVTSPVDGVIVSRKVDVGQTVAASFQTPTLFSIARDLTRMQIDASVDEADIGRVAEGQHVRFSVDAFPEEEFEGKVVQVRIAPETTDNVVTYTVVIHVDNPGLRLKPGMTANVSIETDFRQNVVKIPSGALRFRPPQALLETLPPSVVSGDAGERAGLHAGYVWVVLNNSLARRIYVRTGITDGSQVEVLSGDVQPGDELALAALERRTGRARLF
ncbi:MAG: efflux RND transporter periplasmic adaptor subunit [Synergistaceae bacterium]|jgi:HlyD family secretion protein|nr:efflux RND transporter periplasmic adaptor subunit [Synergistaceae bacterium]